MMFNKLSHAQSERLYLLLEELGEAVQAIGKVLRHGYECTHPDGGPTNREALERELGDVGARIFLLTSCGDLNAHEIAGAHANKLLRPDKYFHHQDEK